MRNSLISRDLKHFWHPCSQMKDHETIPLLGIAAAQGCYLKTTSGTDLFDAISSWWCKSLGHGHPRLKQALLHQCEQMEHVMMAGITHETIVKLSEMLSTLIPQLDKVLYASDGACAVEIALKMSLHARQILGEPYRKKFAALCNGYHGETLGALSVSDVGIYKKPYEALLFPTIFIANIPYVSGINDPLWHDCQSHWELIEKQLNIQAHQLTAIIIEPIVQGAGGMKIYSADFLKRLREWTKIHDIHLIADEIMTGLGRTGKILACEHANIVPDFLCLSKGLTSGFLPMSAVLTTHKIYDYFYDDYETGKSFLHSHTFSGNALAAAVACETIRIIKAESMAERAEFLGGIMYQNMQALAEEFPILNNIRGVGAIVAADIITKPKQRLTHSIVMCAAKHGIFLRPLGNTIYWLPPLITQESDLQLLYQASKKVLQELL